MTIPTRAAMLDLQAENARLLAALATRQTSIDQIARMKLMPDDKINRITLHAAIEVAKLHASNQQIGENTK